ncbi:acetyltransferase [Dehalobacter sp. DCM]|uniref:acetyltransferase n=1 Tax=Dehalobacter sp. DCM TaxID=2907827 RepID=UPI0030813784|nr:acetyltransferase [Dehalobacter sp. DCM]
MTKLILIGAGGHSKVIKDIADAGNSYHVHAVLDDFREDTTIVNDVIYANTSFMETLDWTQSDGYHFCIAIGNNAARKKIVERLSIPLEHYAVLIHPSAVVSLSARIGFGTVVMPQAVINADAILGNHCIVNTGAVVEHDNRLGDYVHISPNASLSGTVSVGEGTHIGSGAVIIPGKKVGNWSTVGAGAVVTKDVADAKTVVGVPAKVIK